METIEITGREVYDAVQNLSKQVTVMNQKLDYLCSTSGDHEKRLRSLEVRRWPLPVVSALLGIVAIGLSIWSIT